MTDGLSPEDRLRHVADLVEHAPIIDAGPETPSADPRVEESFAGDEFGPSDRDPTVADAVVRGCAGLDHSDTDNGVRLRAHFGRDILVLAQARAQRPVFVTWAGDHWDMDGGGPAARILAQKVGGRIALEADFLAQTPPEEAAIAEGRKAEAEREALDAAMAAGDGGGTPEQIARRKVLLAAIADADAARAELKKRKTARRKFAVSSKNNARIEAMLACAAPHLLREPEGFNADPLLVATKHHTLRFRREEDPECPDPDVVRHVVTCDVVDGHRREDFVTKVVPVAYDKDAACPKWAAFLERFQPVEEVRAFLQVYSGIGLLGLSVQKVAFHYGLGANGKSVFMETLMRVLGAYAIGLPAESIVGDTSRGAGGASPDLARLFAVRALRVLELPADKALDEALIKKLTGGERMPVRDLFAGYFEFTPVFTGHMSGNGYPRIDGTDNGIWRRMCVVHWPVTLAPEEQREFEDVLAMFALEYPGILNWLIEGARQFLAHGLIVPGAVAAATKDYRDEMDPVGEFIADCLATDPGHTETARTVYDAYVSWCLANARKPIFETKFGRTMKTRFQRSDGRVREYLDCRLHDVPARPEAPRNPGPD